MYQFLTGPLLWITLSIFVIGCLARVIGYFRGLDWRLDRVAYREHMFFGLRGALHSVMFWLIPFNTRAWKTNPLMPVLFFVFHAGLLITPVFLQAHNILLKERWGFRLPVLPEPVADVLTIAVLVCAVVIVLRRIALPEVRILTGPYDLLLLAVVTAPFFSGLMAHLHMGDYSFWIIFHIISAEILLIAIPFTRLSHFVLFFCSRIQLGMDFGIKRGGMKNKGFAW